jgi:hypothetical protein
MSYVPEQDSQDALVFPLLTAEEVGRDLLGGVPPKTVSLYAREGRSANWPP